MTLQTQSASSTRILTFDLARLLAIVGMIYVHLAGGHYLISGEQTPLWAEVVGAVAAGNSSTLFAVLGGVGIILASRRYTRVGANSEAVVAVATRGALVVILGVALELAGPSLVMIVLIYFGASIMVAALLLRLRPLMLIIVASLLAVAGSPLSTFVRDRMGFGDEPTQLMLTHGTPIETLATVFVTGQYPVITWLVYMLVGMAMAKWRTDSASWRTRSAKGSTDFAFGLTLLAIGAGLIAGAMVLISVTGQGGFWINVGNADGNPFDAMFTALNTSGHSGTVVDIARGVGVSLAVIGAVQMTLSRVSTPSFLLRVLAGTGAASLTIYTLHAVSAGLAAPMFAAGDPLSAWWYFGAWAFPFQVGMMLLLGLTLTILGRRGPLESIVSIISRHTARLVRLPKVKLPRPTVKVPTKRHGTDTSKTLVSTDQGDQTPHIQANRAQDREDDSTW